MLYDTVFHVGCIGFLFGILCFRANGWSFRQGQISSVPILLWTAGHITYNGWVEPMLALQLYMGDALIKLLGFSYTLTL